MAGGVNRIGDRRPVFSQFRRPLGLLLLLCAGYRSPKQHAEKQNGKQAECFHRNEIWFGFQKISGIQKQYKQTDELFRS
jgi:hypothetical protein